MEKIINGVKYEFKEFRTSCIPVPIVSILKNGLPMRESDKNLNILHLGADLYPTAYGDAWYTVATDKKFSFLIFNKTEIEIPDSMHLNIIWYTKEALRRFLLSQMDKLKEDEHYIVCPNCKHVITEDSDVELVTSGYMHFKLNFDGQKIAYEEDEFDERADEFNFICDRCGAVINVRETDLEKYFRRLQEERSEKR